jgi:two-component system LytT family response regulator
VTAIRTMVVDDEPAARAAIRTLLAEDPEIRVVAECADGAAALAAIAAERPALLLLDIQMPEMDGFALLRRLGAERLPVVVFVTAYDAYALRAFEVHALDYLLKPFDDARFRDAMTRAKQQVRLASLGDVSEPLRRFLAGAGTPGAEDAEPWARRLVTRAEGRMIVIAVDDVDWIEADGDHARIHVGGTAHLMRETMKHLESQLDPTRFVRIHRSIIANVDRIAELQPYFRGEVVAVLKDGTRLKVARGSRTQLARAIGQAV